jgi:hypothetical protein
VGTLVALEHVELVVVLGMAPALVFVVVRRMGRLLWRLLRRMVRPLVLVGLARALLLLLVVRPGLVLRRRTPLGARRTRTRRTRLLLQLERLRPYILQRLSNLRSQLHFGPKHLVVERALRRGVFFGTLFIFGTHLVVGTLLGFEFGLQLRIVGPHLFLIERTLVGLQ